MTNDERTCEARALPPLVQDPDPLPFPLDSFPDWLADFCRDVAASTAAPVDFVGNTMLVVAGAAIGNSRVLRIKNDWYEGPRFYVALVGDPASGKTPAMAAVLQPYQEIQQRRMHEYHVALAAYERALHQSESTRPQLVLPSASADRAQVSVAPPKPARLIVDDATVEALAVLLHENPRGLLMPLDELPSWFQRTHRTFWRSVWSGRPSVVDRKGQLREPIEVAQPSINVIGGIQPDLLPLLAAKHGHNDGFLDRLLVSYPKTQAASDWSDATVSAESQSAWQDQIVRLCSLEMREADTGLAPAEVALSPAAQQRFSVWWDAHASEMRNPDLSATLIGSWGKLRTYAARLTLVLHYLWAAGSGPIERDVDAVTVDRAVLLIDYFKSHLRRVHGRLRQSPEEKLYDDVLNWIRRNGGSGNARDLVRARLVSPSKRAWALLQELEALGYGRFDEFKASNNKTVRRFLLCEP
jgi:hypothetical protein